MMALTLAQALAPAGRVLSNIMTLSPSLREAILPTPQPPQAPLAPLVPNLCVRPIWAEAIVCLCLVILRVVSTERLHCTALALHSPGGPHGRPVRVL